MKNHGSNFQSTFPITEKCRECSVAVRVIVHYVISALCIHFDWILLMISQRTDARMASSLKIFSLCFSKMTERFENLEDVLPDWLNEVRRKKSC